jgi:glycosyltransferase involved in cell wall biosynthesis
MNANIHRLSSDGTSSSCSPLAARRSPLRLAVIVSHPIQYYAPLYRRLTDRKGVQIRVFFTWHAGEEPKVDRGFGKTIAWDIPLTDGYEYEVVSNVARDPGTHHFWGLRNPGLVERVREWKPDAVHLTGYSYASHLQALRTFSQMGTPVLFRGDSHLLDRQDGWKWLLKRSLLRVIYRWPAGFLYVGQANRAYYEMLDVPGSKLFNCPHSIDVARFAEPDVVLERQAEEWRRNLGIAGDAQVLLFAGKFEPKKSPLELMKACVAIPNPRLIVLMLGDGMLSSEIQRGATGNPERFRVLPFQNQSKMPLVYRLGHVFTLPSSWGETWGLAVNEAIACGRPVLVSDRVGCAPDVVEAGRNGFVFGVNDWADFREKLAPCLELAKQSKADIRKGAQRFDISVTETALVAALHLVARRL